MFDYLIKDNKKRTTAYVNLKAHGVKNNKMWDKVGKQITTLIGEDDIVPDLKDVQKIYNKYNRYKFCDYLFFYMTDQFNFNHLININRFRIVIFIIVNFIRTIYKFFNC